MLTKDQRYLVWVLTAEEDQVGPRCENVAAPRLSVLWAEGYREALTDVRALLSASEVSLHDVLLTFREPGS